MRKIQHFWYSYKIFEPFLFCDGFRKLHYLATQNTVTFDMMYQCQKFKAIRQSIIYYAGSVGQWDKLTVDQASDGPSIFFHSFLLT